MAKPKCMQEPIDKAAEMKRHGLANRDICQTVDVAEQAFSRWINKPANRAGTLVIAGKMATVGIGG